MTSAMDQDLYDKPDGELIHLSNWVECVRSRKRPTRAGRGRCQCRIGGAPGQPGAAERVGGGMEGVTGVGHLRI